MEMVIFDPEDLDFVEMGAIGWILLVLEMKMETKTTDLL